MSFFRFIFLCYFDTNTKIFISDYENLTWLFCALVLEYNFFHFCYRPAGRSDTSESKIDYGGNGACGADKRNPLGGNCSTDDELLREKHKYVVLLPVHNSEAKSINDNKLNQGKNDNQNKTRGPYTSRSKSSGVKKMNIFKEQGGTQYTKGYSFAVDPDKNR